MVSKFLKVAAQSELLFLKPCAGAEVEVASSAQDAEDGEWMRLVFRMFSHGGQGRHPSGASTSSVLSEDILQVQDTLEDT